MTHGISIETKTSISTLDDTVLQNYTIFLCVENKAFYLLIKTATDTVDSEEVLSTLSGSGRWVKFGARAGGASLTVISEPFSSITQTYPQGSTVVSTHDEKAYFYIDGTDWLVVDGYIDSNIS
jgi:hypothetical protein